MKILMLFLATLLTPLHNVNMSDVVTVENSFYETYETYIFKQSNKNEFNLIPSRKSYSLSVDIHTNDIAIVRGHPVILWEFISELFETQNYNAKSVNDMETEMDLYMHCVDGEIELAINAELFYSFFELIKRYNLPIRIIQEKYEVHED